MRNDKMVVMLATEGTYPFHQGGVSTWCDILVKRLDPVDYVVYSIVMNPFVTQAFKLPEGTGLIKMPLWGTEEPSEHLKTPFSQNYLAKKRTTSRVIKEHFIPLFSELVEEIISPHKNPQKFGKILLDLHLYFQSYEYKISFKSEEAWEIFKQIVLQRVADKGYKLARPDIYCLIQSLGWIYRFLNIINTPIPDSHVTHASAAAFCGIPCVIAKLKNNTPFLLTEHGIYLREQYLSLSKREYSSFLNTFLIRLVHSVNGLNYFFADQVSPVCQYNTRWELELGVEPKNIQVIYNGVDTNVFTEAPAVPQPVPTVVTVARIDPLKDIQTLIRSAVIVKEKIPNVKFVVYGSISVPGYYDECLAVRKNLGLEETVIFAGHTSNISEAYKTGDVVALTSISEAFPYSVVEAMMTGKPVISTDVGGVKEAIGDTGILVKPQDFEELALGIIKLLTNVEFRHTLGREARERALNHFTLDKVLELHLKSYIKLAVRALDHLPAVEEHTEVPLIFTASLKRQRAYMEKGFALRATGLYEEAISYFRLAIKEAPESAAVPVLLMEVAEAYNNLGEYDLAFHEFDKYQAIVYLLDNRTA